MTRLAPKDLQPGSKAQDTGDSRNHMVGRILLFTESFQLLRAASLACPGHSSPTGSRRLPRSSTLKSDAGLETSNLQVVGWCHRRLKTTCFCKHGWFGGRPCKCPRAAFDNGAWSSGACNPAISPHSELLQLYRSRLLLFPSMSQPQRWFFCSSASPSSYDYYIYDYIYIYIYTCVHTCVYIYIYTLCPSCSNFNQYQAP